MTTLQFITTEPEISGASLADSLGIFTNRTLMRLRHQYGLSIVNRRAWYPAHSVTNLLRDLSHTPDGPFTLISMGITWATRIPLPERTRDLHEALEYMTEALYQSWRGGLPGTITIDVKSQNRLFWAIEDPVLPVDFLYGMVYGLTHRVVCSSKDVQIERSLRDGRLIFDIGSETPTAPFKR